MMDCQLQSMSQTARENGGLSTPLVDGSLMRQSPQLILGDAPDGDDTDPDVIPNQYGKICILITHLVYKLECLSIL
jgi:hypothetical protein